MRHSVLVFVLLKVVSVVLVAQPNHEAKPIHYSPNFLVRNQLSPELLKVEFGSGVKSGNFEDLNGATIDQLTKNSYSISGYPLAIVEKEFTQLYAGFGYTNERLSGLNTMYFREVLVDSRHSANVNLFLNSRIKPRFFLSNYIQVGLNSSGSLSNVNNSSNWLALTKINFKKNSNTNFALGAVYVSNLGDPFVLPVLGFAYSTSHYVLNIDFPVKAEIEALLKHGKWRPIAGLMFPASSYYSESTNQYLQNKEMQWQVGVRYQVLKFIYAFAGYRGSFSEEYSLGEKSHKNEIGSLNGHQQVIVAMSIQIAKEY